MDDGPEAVLAAASRPVERCEARILVGEWHLVRGDAAAAFKDAPYRRRERMKTQRHYGLTMEPRGVLAEWDAGAGILRVFGAAKVPFFNRRILAAQIKLPEASIDMVEKLKTEAKVL